MNGYCKIGEISVMPANAKYRMVSRKQSTMSQLKLKRLLKRGTITDDKVKDYKAKMFAEKRLDQPWLNFVSRSNGNQHRLKGFWAGTFSGLFVTMKIRTSDGGFSW